MTTTHGFYWNKICDFIYLPTDGKHERKRPKSPQPSQEISLDLFIISAVIGTTNPRTVPRTQERGSGTQVLKKSR